MNIELLPPFDKMAGQKNITLNIKDSIKVTDFLELLCSEYPQIKSCLDGMKIEDTVYWRLIAVREGVLLKPNELLKNEDKIVVSPPLMGG